jgi:site-specific DNA recombinase
MTGKWGFQRKFEKGDIFTKYKNFMGYDCVDDEIVIVPEQAKVVRKIFDLYLQGLSLGQIKSYLESQGIITVTGKDDWNAKIIRDMLKNEKYKGETMLQKTFTEDFMTGKKSKNIGKYLLGNLLVCGDCGAPYRRRTERGRVVWCCATRIEKGKEACPHSHYFG